MKKFNGKAIYTPAGRALEYSPWACNLYNGCSSRCTFCYNRKGRSAKILGGDIPTIKKSLQDPVTALIIFQKEMNQNLKELQQHGLHFNFVSDPCLPETIEVNQKAMRLCIVNDIPVRMLTKQTWWVKDFLKEFLTNGTIWNTINTKHLFDIGFTLTGQDHMEPGADTNMSRVVAMMQLHNAGFKTWASIEPIITLDASLYMIGQVRHICDTLKIGLESGGKYDRSELVQFVARVLDLTEGTQAKLYFKDSLLKKADLTREFIEHLTNLESITINHQ